MKKTFSGLSVAMMLCLAVSAVHAQNVTNGEKIYKAKCATCHGPDGKGEALPAKLKSAGHLLR